MLQKEQQREPGSGMAEEKIIEAALPPVARNFPLATQCDS
jgi:hypothetical protein